MKLWCRCSWNILRNSCEIDLLYLYQILSEHLSQLHVFPTGKPAIVRVSLEDNCAADPGHVLQVAAGCWDAAGVRRGHALCQPW